MKGASHKRPHSVQFRVILVFSCSVNRHLLSTYNIKAPCWRYIVSYQIRSLLYPYKLIYCVLLTFYLEFKFLIKNAYALWLIKTNG